jgi:hypothetical protein
MYADQNTVLIDDFKRNTAGFIAAGGNAILLDSENGDYSPMAAVNQLRQLVA